ncbi:hypothetical protein EK904_012383 [Melospiza melodia maxima]|nr:hypothetical protein EK904_012383 [Melospiza melodia maxima]
MEGEGSVKLKQRNIWSQAYPECPGFTAGYSPCKLQGVTPPLSSSFLFQNRSVLATKRCCCCRRDKALLVLIEFKNT